MSSRTFWIWLFSLACVLSLMAFGCSGGGVQAPTLPAEGSIQPSMHEAGEDVPPAPTSNRGTWGRYFMVINEEDMSIDIVPNRTAEEHYDVTWVKDICPECISASCKKFDPNTRTFWIELHTKNPTKKTGYDVRFIIDLDGTGEYDMLDPDNYTRLHDDQDLPNPFRALATEIGNRAYHPWVNQIDNFQLYISADHSPISHIPFVIDVSFPGRCLEPYMITNIDIDGEFPPGGGGDVTVSLVAWDTQHDQGEVWLRTAGIFTPNDILMTPGADVGVDGKAYSATFSNVLGGGWGLTPIVIEAYTADTQAEPYPLNDYARIFADPGGQSAIAGEVFNALTRQPANGAVVTVTNTGAGADPLPYPVTDGTYNVTVLADTYSVKAVHSVYFLQDTIYDVVVPPQTTVYVCFGLAPKYLDDPKEALATISGHVRDEATGLPIAGAQTTLDGGDATGGVIQTRITDEHGHFCFYAVPTFQQTDWTVHAFHPDYLPDSIENVPSLKNKSTPQVDFDLTPLQGPPIWRENFEPGSSNVGTMQDWVFQSVTTEPWPIDEFGNPLPGASDFHDEARDSDILWRVWNPLAKPIQDVFFHVMVPNPPGPDTTICWLPPDDLSDGWIPAPFEGDRYLWYGEDFDDTPGQLPQGDYTHRGSFIDEWSWDDYGMWRWLGGYSANEFNAGWAMTGPIDLSAYSELTLTFQSYWEIEAVDPSIEYDAMDVLISTDGLWWDRLDRLNPLAEPIPDEGNEAKAYTTAGFDQAAVWSPSVIDISAYGGNSQVWLRFDFDTRDMLYNGFRGWILDDIAIYPFKM